MNLYCQAPVEFCEQSSSIYCIYDATLCCCADGNRAMGFKQMGEKIRSLKRSRSDPIQYSLTRSTNTGNKWKRIGGDHPGVGYAQFDMPEMPPFGSEDLPGHVYMRKPSWRSQDWVRIHYFSAGKPSNQSSRITCITILLQGLSKKSCQKVPF